MMEAQGQTPDFNEQYPGAGGATAGWLERQDVVAKIREQYFREHDEQANVNWSKIDDVPLEYVNRKLQRLAIRGALRLRRTIGISSMFHE